MEYEFSIKLNENQQLVKMWDKMVLQEKIAKEYALYVSQIKYAEIHNFFPS